MNETSLATKTFPFRLASWLPHCYTVYGLWLSYLLERLGHGCTLAIWHDAFQNHNDAWLAQILATGWAPVAEADSVDVESAVEAQFAELFPGTISDVPADEARRMVDATPPIPQIRQAFPALNVWRQITAYEALHLYFDGLARLAETLIRRHGKQGELIVYDVLRTQRVGLGEPETGTVAEFMASFTAEPEEANLYTAGLEIDRLSTSDHEVVQHVTLCAWAKYFRAHHPSVGYLIACSTDEVAFRAYNDRLRMQRISTLMEGGEVCDFRIYAVEAGEMG